MKHYLLTIALTLYASTITLGQPGLEYLTFEDTTYMQHLFVDTNSNSNNIWQIGKPQKTIFTSAFSGLNAIVTDTINPYPINDTSSFIITHIVYVPAAMCGTYVSGYYKVNSDTINDFGTIEFSLNNGQTWTNILSGSPDIDTNTLIPMTLTGNSNGWKNYGFTLKNIQQYNGDTVLFRYTFISDGSQSNKDGLMFDNIQIGDLTEGIEEAGCYLIHSSVFPNPTVDNLNIEFDNKNNLTFNLIIFDNTGKTIKTISDIKNNSVKINIQDISSGLYYYKLTNAIDIKYATGRFVKQ